MPGKKNRRASNGSGSWKRRADGTWEHRASYGYGPSGELVRKSFYGKTQAECREKKKEYDKTAPAPLEESLTVSGWAASWLELYKKGKCSAKMQDQYEHIVNFHIAPEIGHLKLSSVKPAHIVALMNKHAEKSESLVKKIMITLRGIFETAIDNDLCAKNPAKNVKAEGVKSKGREVFTDRELAVIENFCLSERSNISDALITLLYTGLRREELLGLMWGDIDFANGQLQVSRCVVIENKAKKIKHELKSETSRRTIPMLPMVARILESKPRECEFVFPAKGSEYQSPDGFSTTYGRLLKRINRRGAEEDRIRELSPHCCRHTFATRLSNKGVDIKMIQSILGHADISMTGNVYAHSSIDGMKNALKGLDFHAPDENNAPNK